MEYNSLENIIKKCQKIRNKKLKDILPNSKDLLITSDKGRLGNLIQKHIFNIQANNVSAPDFEKLGIELKVTGLIKYKKDNVGRKYKAKERISLGMINYNNILNEGTFLKSHIYLKMKKTLYIFYEYRYDKPMSEWKIVDYKYIELDSSNNLENLMNDYNIIYSKINEGRAEELSESLTKELGATIKGSGKCLVKQPNSSTLAKPRAFSWKPNYVNKIFYTETTSIQEHDVIDFIINRVQPFLGMSLMEIYESHNFIIPKSKNQKKVIFTKIMNVKEYSEIPNIKQSDYKIKNIELKSSLKLKEEIGLMNVNVQEFINNVPFEESELYTFLISYKFLFIVWMKNKKDLIFKKVVPFQFDSTLIKKAEFVYMDTKDKFLNGMQLELKNGKRYTNLIHKSDNKGFHLRPHGLDGKDITKTPYGQIITKHQYWLNSNEVEDWIKIY
ncbi:MAG: MutH/Sau3AI family endonuclease [Metamycoplasmataceae bacterium]